MLIQIILLMISTYYLKHGLYPLLTGKPAVKADAIRKTVIILVVLELLSILCIVFLAFVALYGYSYGGITVGDLPFYVLLFLLCLLILWVFYRLENDSDALKQSVALIAVHPDFALVTVRETLTHMGVNYRETLSGFEIVEKGITVPVKISGKRIRFTVNRPLDKIFLNQFCKAYQTVYQQRQYPPALRFALLSTALGVAVLAIFTVSLLDYLLVIKNILTQISALSTGFEN